MKIFYWSPFLSNIATIDAVLNSIRSLLIFDKKNNFKPFIIDSTGEWLSKKNKTTNISIIKLYEKEFYNSLPKGGFFKSRLSQILIFILNFNKLRKLLNEEKPEYFIAHLIISLPILIFSIFNFKTKLIIRISGTPKLNFFRKFIWSKLSKNIELVTCPTKTTFYNLKNLKIFPENKLKILYDPIISFRKINNKKKEKIEEFLKNKEYILSVGRLTKQKNFSLLINSFFEICKKYSNLNLVILGEGEERKNLEKQIKKFNLEEKVFLLGFRKNVYSYLNSVKFFISSSLYEDPGFAIIEAGCLNKIIIAADTNTGPTEILDNSNRGYLFINNDYKSLIEKYLEFTNSERQILYKKKVNMKKYCKNFTYFSHYKSLKEILY